jgi:hypothetical protein
MQELFDSINRPNTRIMGIEEGEKVQAKSISNIVSKITAKNFPKLKKELSIQVQVTSRTPNKHDQFRTSPQHIIVKIISTDNK